MTTHHLLDTLESRTLLAATFSGTDVDGDTYTLNLSGPGAMVVNTSGGGTTGFLQSVQLNGTTPASNLTISVTQSGGNGSVDLHSLQGSALNKLTAPKVNLDAGGAIALAGLKSMTLGDVANGAIVDVPGAPTDRVSIIVGTVGSADFVVAPRVSLFRLQHTNTADLLFNAGVDRIESANNFQCELTVTDATNPVSVGTVIVGNFLEMDWTVPRDIVSVTAGQVRGDSDLSCGGVVRFIRSIADFLGELTAARFGRIVADAGFRAEIRTFQTDAAGLAIGSITVAGDMDADIRGLAPGQEGGLGTLTVGSCSGGVFVMTFIRTIKCTGDFTPAFVDLAAGAGRPLAIQSAKIGGRVGGDFEVRSTVRSLTAGFAQNFLMQDATFAATLGTLALTSTVDTSTVTIRMGFASTVSARSTLRGTIDLRAPNAVTGRALGTLKAPRLSELTVPSSFVGGIGLIAASRIDSCTLAPDFVVTLSLKALPGDAVHDGSFRFGSLQTTGADALGRSLGKGTLAGPLNAATFDLDSGGVGTLSMGVLTSATLNAQFVGALTLGSVAAAGVVMSGASINLVGEDAQGFAAKTMLFKGTMQNASLIAAGAIGSYTSNRQLNTTLEARSFGSIKVLPGNGQDGSITNSSVFASTPGGPGVVGLGALTAGAITNATISTAGDIGAFTALSLTTVDLAAGLAINIANTFNRVTPLANPGGVIKSIRLTRAFDPVNPALASTRIVAATINSINILGATDETNGGVLFGIAARTVGLLTMRDAANAVIKPLLPAAGADAAPIGGDFRLRGLA